MSENTQSVKRAIRKLGKQATFKNIVKELEGTMTLDQVRGTIAGLAQNKKKIRKGTNGVYLIVRRKRNTHRQAPVKTKPVTKRTKRRPSTDGTLNVINAIRSLGSTATFNEIQGHFAGKMTLEQVRSTVASLCKHDRIHKGRDGVYHIVTRRKSGQSKTATTPAKRATKKMVKKSRRPSVLVNLDRQIADCEEQLAALQELRRLAKKNPAAVQKIVRSCQRD